MAAASLFLPPVLLLLLLASLPAIANAQTEQGSATILPGSSLSLAAQGVGASWPSPSGRFAFGFYAVDGGFKVGIWLTTAPQRTVVWTANRDDPPVADGTVRLSFDGRLLWSAPGGREKLISQGAREPGASAAMLDSGKFVLYNSGNRVVWSTFDSPTDTMLPGQSLLAGDELLSRASEGDWSTGKFRLKMQNDGNLVLYPVDTTDTANDAYWDTGTFMVGFPLTLNLSSDGSLYLSGNNSRFLKNLTQAKPPSSSGNRTEVYYRATLDTDGVFRLYSHRFEGGGSSSTNTVEWAALKDRCLVKGTCGYNSFCQPAANGVPNCLCPPSFEFVDPTERFLGCQRNYSGDGCEERENKAGTGSFSMATMENTFWVDQPYAVLSSTSAEECRAACLSDCFCGAALFQDGTCTKQLLPLRYGRKSENYTAFIKVGAAAAPPDEHLFWKDEKSKMRVDVLVICVVLAAASVVIFAISAILLYRNRRVKGYTRPFGTESSALDEENPMRSFSYQELETATGSFTEELGRGAFGTVFKGSLAEGARIIAVKRLDKMVEEGEKEFQREVRAIGRTHHRNLVRLLGFCNEGSNRLLVYEYMGNGSLADLLFKGNQQPTWEERLRIAVDVARGLQYLHEELETHIIHCDIKPQNILMDSTRTAKISDFGLAKLMMPDQTRTFTGIRGTRGYLAPEWHKNSPITVKTDVYSFGVVLLEIVCCRRNMELEEAGEDFTLSEYVYELFKAGELEKLLSGEVVDEMELERVVQTGIWCVQNDPASRPSMKSVILMLERNMQVPLPPPPSPLL